MKRAILYSLAAASIFAAITVAGADVRGRFEVATESFVDAAGKRGASFLKGRSVRAGFYRSPGALRKVTVASEDFATLRSLASAGAVELADYGSFKLFAVENAAAEKLETGAAFARRLDSQSEAAPSFIVRDDYNVLLLRAGAIDTTDDGGAGRFFGLGRATGWRDKAAAGLDELEARARNPQLRLIQFIGPVRDEWLDRLRQQGLEPLAYVPNNAYLVRGGDARRQIGEAARLAYARGEAFIQWEGPFLDEYKIHPALIEVMNDPLAGEVTIAVQLLGDEHARSNEDLAAVKARAASLLGNEYVVAGYTTLRLRISAERLAEVAALPTVINLEPWVAPSLADERASQIAAGEVSDDGKSARGPGYMAWLAARGFAAPFNFVIDVTDSGLDRGSTAANLLHEDFLDGNGQSRVVYARDYTSEEDPSDLDGHGTINASIAAGANISNGVNRRDNQGFNSGLGAAPFARIGASKIFQSTGRFDLPVPYSKLVADAYMNGARISSNSWSAATNSYTIDSQEYDSRVRDALPAQAGNQEMVFVFASGNSGPGRAGMPGTGKNVIAVGAGEGARGGGADGCGVRDDDADSAHDIAFFSGGGPLEDGRIKPDLVAPGTHIIGAASQHPEFDGTGVCGLDFDKPYFPANQTLYTWSSGTSHSTPIVAGIAALARQHFLNRGMEPSAALIKALLVNTTTYMTGELAGGDLPHRRQGMGLVNAGRMFDATPKIFINQTEIFSESGESFVLTGEIRDASQPFRVTLAWTDAPGLSSVAPWVNDLDLEVVINGQVYRGNNFKNDVSQPGGVADARNNVESVWLPAGTTGVFAVRVRASNLAGDGVPGNFDATDQDFALVIYNGERRDVAVTTIEEIAVQGGGDATADPGESVSLRIGLMNRSLIPMNGARGVLTTASEGVTFTQAAADFPNIAPGGEGTNGAPFQLNLAPSVPCGAEIELTLELTAQGSVSRIPFRLSVGRSIDSELFADGAEEGRGTWSTGSLIKKKKKQVDTWTITAKRKASGSHAWFSPAPAKVVDAFLATQPLQLPANARKIHFTFMHAFEFEPGGFDGAVLEISVDGKKFEDLGDKIITGGYTGTLFQFSDNPLANRPGWIEGRLGPFQPVVVDLSSFAGKTVIVRFRIGADRNVKSIGWYIDDVRLNSHLVECAP